MMSPFYFWVKHKKKHCDKLMHKLLFFHIPISVCFHFSCSLGCNNVVREVFKLLDLSMIHLYSIVSATEIRIKRTTKTRKMSVLHVQEVDCLQQLGIWLNIYCILKILKGYNHDNELLRVASIVIMGYSTLHCSNNLDSIVKLGAISSFCYLCDEHLFNLGHPLFHLILGCLHNQLFVSFDII